jgi:hypothetical protein
MIRPCVGWRRRRRRRTADASLSHSQEQNIRVGQCNDDGMLHLHAVSGNLLYDMQQPNSIKASYSTAHDFPRKVCGRRVQLSLALATPGQLPPANLLQFSTSWLSLAGFASFEGFAWDHIAQYRDCCINGHTSYRANRMMRIHWHP